MKGWTQEKTSEFASRWADPEDDHPWDLCEEFGISRGRARVLFGKPSIRKFPRVLTAKAWKELKEDWFTEHGPSSEEIVAKYNISRSVILKFLPPIRKARQGKTGSTLKELLGEAQFQELSDKINTGEFTTFSALVEEYPQASIGKITSVFGSPVEIKKRVVAENCPSTMSKSQYLLAKSRWFDPNGGTRDEIAQAAGTTGSTLIKAFGLISKSREGQKRVRSYETGVMDDAVAAWHADPEQSIRTISETFNVPYRALLDRLPQDMHLYRVLSPTLFDAVTDWFSDPLRTVAEIAEHHGCSSFILNNVLPSAAERRRLKRTFITDGRGGSPQFRELMDQIRTGEFTTYSAIADQHPEITPYFLRSNFGSLADLKKRVVAADCPPNLSKSQYTRAKERWFDPNGGHAQEIAQEVGVSFSTLYAAFGKLKECRRGEMPGR